MGDWSSSAYRHDKRKTWASARAVTCPSSPGFPSGGVSQAAGVYYGPNFDVTTTQGTSAPEPGAWILVAAGLALLGVTRAIRASAPVR